jgi:hypothetical protein
VLVNSGWLGSVPLVSFVSVKYCVRPKLTMGVEFSSRVVGIADLDLDLF